MNRKLPLIALMYVLFISANSCKNKENREHLKLWYKQPAKALAKDNPYDWKDDEEWLKALPLGNGSLGVMVFGDVNYERIQLSEESMWSGSPADNDNRDAVAAQTKIRELLFRGDYEEATRLTNETQICKGAGSGSGNGANVPFGCFQTLGDLYLDFGKSSGFSNYHRELDLDDAVVRVSYEQEGITFYREIFASHADHAMVARFSANKTGQLSFECFMNRPERYKSEVKDGHLVMSGALHDGNGGDGLQYMARLAAVNKGGKVSYSDSTIIVENADEVILYLTASTNHVLEYPHYKGRDYKKITKENLENAKRHSFPELIERHKAEYQPYYSRVNFSLGDNIPDNIPTDERLANFRNGQTDNKLVELLFQYGRYLLIASSRPGALPANLQGVWANKIQTPWNGDYHTDVNIEMNYWPAEVTNLSEMHLPLFDLIESIVPPGQKTAQVQYNNNGWVVHPITNIWGYTSPGEKASWGMHTGAGAWICQHIGEHYRFTGDKEFIKRMYPVLKGSVEFYLDWLVEHPKTGKLVSGPAVSPENTFIAPDGSRCQISMGPAHDQQVIWQLFTDYIIVVDELGIMDNLYQTVKEAKEKLAGPKIASDGRLMEWEQEFPEVEPGHRHISHLFAVHPGNQINLENTPEWAAAAKKSLDYRIENGGGHTGWSAAWLINQYARLQEADKALNSLNTVIKKSTSHNLFGQHPPFQMDANFGTTAGIAEMLIQSHSGSIHLLPALPDEWKVGEVQGLKARGNIAVDMNWKDGNLTEAIIMSENDKVIKIKYRELEREISLKAGQIYRFQL